MMEGGAGTPGALPTSHRTASLLFLGIVVACLAAGSASIPLGEVASPADTGGGPFDRDEPGRAEEAAGSWWAEAGRSIRDAEYDITWQEMIGLRDLDRAWQAPNRAQGFRSYFTDRGVRMIPRTGGEPAWEWALSLVGYGRSRWFSKVGGATLHPAGHRIELRRARILEEYVNEPRGLEQRFTLDVPPEELALSLPGTPEGGALPGGRGPRRAEEEDPACLVLALSGTLSGTP